MNLLGKKNSGFSTNYEGTLPLLHGISLVSYKEMQTQEDVSIEDAVLGSNERDCDEATDEELMDEEEAYESPYDTENETTTETQISEDEAGAVPNKSERLDI